MSQGNFIKATRTSESILVVKLIKHADYIVPYAPYDTIKRVLSIEVEVIKIIQGHEDRKVIKIFGSNGMDCRGTIRDLEVGHYYIVGLDKSKSANEQFGVREKPDDYVLSGCGEYLINYYPEKNTVRGRLNEKVRRIKDYTFLEFETLMSKRE